MNNVRVLNDSYTQWLRYTNEKCNSQLNIYINTSA